MLHDIAFVVIFRKKQKSGLWSRSSAWKTVQAYVRGRNNCWRDLFLRRINLLSDKGKDRDHLKNMKDFLLFNLYNIGISLLRHQKLPQLCALSLQLLL